MDYFAVFQNIIYDGIYETEEEATSEIVIVGIDDLSYEQIGRWPYSREIQSQIFANILRDKPAVLGLDIIYDSKTNDSDDKKLLETLKSGNVVCASILLSGKEQWGYVAEDTYITPFKELKKVVNTGYINTYTEEKDNGVVRKTYRDWETVS